MAPLEPNYPQMKSRFGRAVRGAAAWFRQHPRVVIAIDALWVFVAFAIARGLDGWGRWLWLGITFLSAVSFLIHLNDHMKGRTR